MSAALRQPPAFRLEVRADPFLAAAECLAAMLALLALLLWRPDALPAFVWPWLPLPALLWMLVLWRWPRPDVELSFDGQRFLLRDLRYPHSDPCPVRLRISLDFERWMLLSVQAQAHSRPCLRSLALRKAVLEPHWTLLRTVLKLGMADRVIE